MTFNKLQPIWDIWCSELGPKPTFRELKALWKPQHLESQPGSGGSWKQHIPTHSGNPHLHFFPLTTKCEADKFIPLISPNFLECYRSYGHFWHDTLIFGNATAHSFSLEKPPWCAKPCVPVWPNLIEPPTSPSLWLISAKTRLPSTLTVNYTKANTPEKISTSLFKH